MLCTHERNKRMPFASGAWRGFDGSDTSVEKTTTPVSRRTRTGHHPHVSSAMSNNVVTHAVASHQKVKPLQKTLKVF